MKLAHWALNALLLSGGGFVVYLGLTHMAANGTDPGVFNRVMTVVSGVALFGIGAAMSVFTWKRG